ncbi:MAG: hypothetical protein OSB62_01160 [Alphaproteobacteria bacterium]|jgi:hypothetical protein|nr:hypothetical protein [Alphaproteobacteria bacterium]
MGKIEKQELDIKDLKTLDTVSENDDDGTPLGASDVPLEAQKADAEAKLAAGVGKLKDLEDKALTIEMELQSRGISMDKDKEQELGINKDQGIEFER